MLLRTLFTMPCGTLAIDDDGPTCESMTSVSCLSATMVSGSTVLVCT